MTEQIIKHFPVMAQNIIARITRSKLASNICLADCNFGFGGHSSLILHNFPKAMVQVYNQNPKVIAYFKQHYQNEIPQQHLKRLTLTNANFSSIQETKIYNKYDVILTDFGFNTFHLETERGFSWLKDQPLDMRYSGQDSIDVFKEVNQTSQLELMSILSRYGELRNSKAIAEAIMEARPIKTTKQLRQAVVKCFQDDKTRKIAQVFQAFRIATNNQLKDIEKLCKSLDKCLNKNGLFLGITFHSLQREVIFQFLRANKKNYSKAQVEEPSKQQLELNSKSRSAKMLSFIRIN